MKPFVRKFTFTRKNGRNGLLPDDAPEFDAGHVIHFAHDILEHPMLGSDFRGELLAAAVTIYGRGIFGYSQFRTTGSDMGNFIAQQYYKIPKISSRWYKPLKDETGEQAVKDLVAITCDLTQDDIKQTANFRYSTIHNSMVAVKEQYTAWLRFGWMLAKRKYKGVPRRNIMRLFEEVTSKMSEYHNVVGLKFGDKVNAKVEYDVPRVTINIESKFNHKTLLIEVNNDSRPVFHRIMF